MGRFAKVLMIGLAALGVLGWMLLVMLGGMVMHSPASPDGIQQDTPGLHADEAVQWSLAKDSSEGVPYSINQDKFHGPALAVAAQVVLAARGLKFDDASEADLRLVLGDPETVPEPDRAAPAAPGLAARALPIRKIAIRGHVAGG